MAVAKGKVAPAKPQGGSSGLRAAPGSNARWREYGTVRRRASVTLDANGDGTVTFDTQTANQKWVIESVVCTVTSATPAAYPQAVVYIGGEQAGSQEGASWTGNQETFTGRIEMTAADTLSVAFASGTEGQVATVVIEGTNWLWR